MRFSRRTLLKTSAAAGVLGALKPLFADERPMPLRDLGRTGEKVSLAGIGTAEWGAGLSDADADRMIARAIDLGINYVDTAYSYGDGHGRSTSAARSRAAATRSTSRRRRSRATGKAPSASSRRASSASPPTAWTSVYPSPRRFPNQFIEFLLKEIKKNRYD